MLKRQMNLCISLVLIFLCIGTPSIATIHITSNTTWNTNQSLSDDYVIDNGVTLTINNGAIIQISPGWMYVEGGGKIEIRDGAKLELPALRLRNNQTNIVENATLTAGNLWLESGYNYCRLLVTNGAIIQSQDISIEQHNILEIEDNSSIEMIANGRISVFGIYIGGSAPGGQLIVKDSKITSAVSTSSWYGISVVGGYKGSSNYPYRRQSEGTTGSAIFNNATIENSDWGVVNWDRSGRTITDWDGKYSGGGIIQATNTVFNNNNIAVQFRKYQHEKTSGAWLDDASFLHGCTFEVGETPGHTSFDGMIRMNDVYGIEILGCDFVNNSGLAYEAVKAQTARFKVDGWCPCGSLSKPTCYATPTNPCVGGTFKLSTFDNTAQAIYADNIMDGNRTVNIQNTKFYNIKEYAISLQGAIRPAIVNNEINLKQDGSNQVKGIALGGCLAYTVMNNKIANTTSNTEKTYGILINSSSQPYDEKVKLNTLGYTATQGSGSLNYALQARGKNYDPGKPSIGLKLFCNNMSSNTNNDATDISVTDLPGDPYHGVSSVQGEISNNTYGAENIFASRSNPTGYNHLNKTAATNAFTYYYYNANAAENPTNKLSSIPTIATSNWKSCDVIGNGNTSTGATSKVYSNYVSDRAALETLLSASDVFDVDEETGYCTYDDLIAQYCVLNETMLDHYLTPEQTYSLGLDSLTGDTLYFADTVVYHPDSMILVLQGCNFLYPYKIWLAGMYAQQGNYDGAYSALETIPASFTLTEAEENALTDYASLLEVRETLEGNDNNWGDIPQATKDWITDAAYNGYGTLRYMARYYLSRYEGISLIPEGWEPEEEAEKQNDKNLEPYIQQYATLSKISVRVYPNPAQYELHIDLAGTAEQAIADIYDIMGRKIMSHPVMPNGTTVIDIEKILPGNYIVKLHCDNTVITIHRLIKQ